MLWNIMNQHMSLMIQSFSAFIDRCCSRQAKNTSVEIKLSRMSLFNSLDKFGTIWRICLIKAVPLGRTVYERELATVSRWYQEALQLFKQLVQPFIGTRHSYQQPKQRVPHKYKQLAATISLREVFLVCLGHSSRAKDPNQWATWDKKVHTSAIWDKNRKLGKYPISHFKRQLLWGPSLWLKIIFWILTPSCEKRALIQILSWNEWVGSIWRWPKTVFHYDSRYFLDGVNLPLSLSLSGSFSGCQWERKLMHFSCRKRIKLLFLWTYFHQQFPL